MTQIFDLSGKKFKKYKSFNPKVWVLYRAGLWFAVELLREPIRRQLKTITHKESGFVGLRICTS